MSIMESVYTVLSGNSTITAALASANSIYPQILPQSHDGFPAVTFRLQGDEDIALLDGTFNQLHRARVWMDVWSPSYKSASDVATIIKSELIGMRGVFGAHTAERVSKGTEFDSDGPEVDTGLNRIVLEFEIAYY